MADQSQATSQNSDRSLSGALSYQSALPIANGRLAMLLFLSTELMFFTAILGTYIVLRLPLQHVWPTQNLVHVNLWIGILNTVILLASCVSLSVAKRKAMADSFAAAKLWLIVTIVLAIGFLSIKGYEYQTKFHHGIYPSGWKSLIHENADQNYLSATVAEIRQITTDLESTVGTDEDEERLARLNLLRAGVIEWTQHKVGKSSDRLTRQQAIDVMAHQIKPLSNDDQANHYLQDEVAEVSAAKQKLQTQLDQANQKLTESQSRLRELSKQKEENPALEDEFAEESRLAEGLTEKIGDIRKEMLPLKNRLEAVDVLESTAEGINDSESVLLPMVIPGGKTWTNTYFLLTGFHLLHLIVGLGVLLGWLFIRFGKSRVHLLDNFSLYWHFVDFVWLVIFAIIYLT